ncbi:hypothetical protein GCM10011613_28700 [Cellvibrio zantedeschiae]|uniref:Glycosyltransferase 2-like domain-containing protein n=1 Tax=Cellvibrio zantedeschiae TaxID=1237077 RepID=A0ABQ3BAW0_9GAMM|nr:glycosyltransferase [Cellvibrio zantedeschiae]GGY82212.1 hypothetical protein GCM10011613_28700 [Cellvibrio zantedeschiae]
MKISVVIPTYNSSKTIVRTLESVFKQTYNSYEVIVVDDGSTDDTVQLLARFKDKITLFCQPNSGAAAARNQGVKLSQGDLIAFLDSDDLWHPQKLEFQVAVFDKHADLGILSTRFQTVREANFTNDVAQQEIPLENLRFELISFDDVFLEPFLATPTVMLKRSLFESLGGFNESLITAEDVDLWLRSCYAAKYALIENELCTVIQQENSLTYRAAYSPFLAHLDVIEAFCKKNEAFERDHRLLINTAKSSIYTCIASAELCLNKKQDARKNLLTAIKLRASFRSIYLLLKTFI